MGLYDTLKIKYPLPDLELQDSIFQTKSLVCAMLKYTINEDGELILHEVEWVEVPEEQRFYYGKPEWEKDDLYKMIGSIKSIPISYKKVNHTGFVRFYKISDNHKKWYEYLAKFVDGKLTNLLSNHRDLE